MEAKGTYAEFVDRMLDEVDFLEAPKATEQLQRLLADCGLTVQPVEEVRKHTVSAIAKYERMISREWRKRPSLYWKDEIGRASCRERV